MSDINIQEILAKQWPELKRRMEAKENYSKLLIGLPQVIAAIKEIVEAVVDYCAEEATVEHSGGILKLGTQYVNKQSILNVKKEINYE